MVIKASGVPYDELDARRDGRLRPPRRRSSRATSAVQRRRHARLRLPRTCRDVGGVAHTHSPYATAWAARGEAIPCVLTAMADEFGGEIPIGPFALIGDEEIGRGSSRRSPAHRSPAVLMRSHGVFTLGRGPATRSRRR